MSEASSTTDHQVIRDWTKARGGKPATVAATGDDDEPGLLRIRFDDDSKDDLQDIGWDSFFQQFEDQQLAFLYQEETADGDVSRFHKFIERS